MSRATRVMRLVLFVLLGLFVFAYPFAVIGTAFDVQSPFPLDWAGSVMLFLEGIILIVATGLLLNWRRALLSGLCVIVLSYSVEALGVQIGFPFGLYRYSLVLQPQLPGRVPLAVMFAWVLIIFGSYGIVKRRESARRGIDVGAALLGAILAVLLDLAIEPVAVHVVHYWEWLAPGPVAYYRVPLVNFVAWFVVAFMLFVLVDRVLRKGDSVMSRQHDDWKNVQKIGWSGRLAMFAPHFLFACSLLMFGLVDLSHGYFIGMLFALLAGLIMYFLYRRRITAIFHQRYNAIKH